MTDHLSRQPADHLILILDGLSFGDMANLRLANRQLFINLTRFTLDKSAQWYARGMAHAHACLLNRRKRFEAAENSWRERWAIRSDKTMPSACELVRTLINQFIKDGVTSWDTNSFRTLLSATGYNPTVEAIMEASRYPYPDRVLEAGDLFGLSNCSTLTSLDLDGRYCNINDASLEKIIHGSRRSLVGLNLSRTNITDQGVEMVIRTCPKLAGLNLASTRVTDSSIFTIACESRLIHLNLSDTRVTGEFVELLATLDSLKGLVMRSVRLSSFFTHLFDSELEELDLSHCDLRCDMREHLQITAPLRKLNMSHTSFSATRARQVLESCPQLTHLNLNNCHIMSDPTDAIPENSHLTELHLGQYIGEMGGLSCATPYTIESLERVRDRCPELRCLTFRLCRDLRRIDPIVETMAQIRKLRIATIDDNRRFVGRPHGDSGVTNILVDRMFRLHPGVEQVGMNGRAVFRKDRARSTLPQRLPRLPFGWMVE